MCTSVVKVMHIISNCGYIKKPYKDCKVNMYKKLQSISHFKRNCEKNSKTDTPSPRIKKEKKNYKTS